MAESFLLIAKEVFFDGHPVLVEGRHDTLKNVGIYLESGVGGGLNVWTTGWFRATSKPSQEAADKIRGTIGHVPP